MKKIFCQTLRLGTKEVYRLPNKWLLTFGEAIMFILEAAYHVPVSHSDSPDCNLEISTRLRFSFFSTQPQNKQDLLD